MKTEKILINIDCIFDTLLGCVFAVNPDWVTPLAQSGYIGRVHNTLSLLYSEIDDELVRQRYLERDIEILQQSRRTNMLTLLADYIRQSNHNPDHPEALDYQVTINTYPYEIEAADLREMFGFIKDILDVAVLNHIHVPLSKLTPSYIKSYYSRFIIYSLNEWTELHGPALVDCKIPKVTCVVPLCYRAGMELKGDMQEAMKWTSAGFSSALDVEFVNLSDMSVCIPADYDFSQEQ